MGRASETACCVLVAAHQHLDSSILLMLKMQTSACWIIVRTRLKSWQSRHQPLCPTAGFANEGQFLIVSSASLRDLQQRLTAGATPSASSSAIPGSIKPPVDVTQFRPNFVVGAADLPPFCEDAWRFIQLGPHFFHVTGMHLRLLLETGCC